MAQWVVIATDHRQGESFCIGPFENMDAAYVWASNDADEKTTEWDLKEGLDCNGQSYISVCDGPNIGDDELVYEWSCEQLVTP